MRSCGALYRMQNVKLSIHLTATGKCAICARVTSINGGGYVRHVPRHNSAAWAATVHSCAFCWCHHAAPEVGRARCEEPTGGESDRDRAERAGLTVSRVERFDHLPRIAPPAAPPAAAGCPPPCRGRSNAVHDTDDGDAARVRARPCCRAPRCRGAFLSAFLCHHNVVARVGPQLVPPSSAAELSPGGTCLPL